MRKIAVIIDDWFEDSEYTEPVKAFSEAGHEVIHVGLETGKTVTGKKENTPVIIDRKAEECDTEEFDALLIPGGFSPDQLRAHEGPINFTKEFMKAKKPVFSICHGPQLLISADCIRGRKVTGFTSIIQDIKNAGAEFLNSEVVKDDNLITSRNPRDLPAFITASLEKLDSI